MAHQAEWCALSPGLLPGALLKVVYRGGDKCHSVLHPAREILPLCDRVLRLCLHQSSVLPEIPTAYIQAAVSLRHVWCWGPRAVFAECFLSAVCWAGRCWQLNERDHQPVTSTGGGDNTGHCYCGRRSCGRPSPRRPVCKGLHS